MTSSVYAPFQASEIGTFIKTDTFLPFTDPQDRLWGGAYLRTGRGCFLDSLFPVEFQVIFGIESDQEHSRPETPGGM